MANPQEENLNPISETTPLSSTPDFLEELYDQEVGYCSCLGLCLLGKWGSRNNKNNNGAEADKGYLLHHHQVQKQEEKELIQQGWLEEKVKKLKEVSEVLAGPRWKNFIRRFRLASRLNNIKKRRSMQYQYDPQSYALNFDDGVDREGSEGDAYYLAFSARFAAPFGMNKTHSGHDSLANSS